MLCVGGEAQIEIRGQLSLREDDVCVIQSGDIANVAAENFQNELTSLRECGSGVGHRGGLIGSICIVLVDYEELLALQAGISRHIQGRAVVSKLSSAGSRTLCKLLAESAVAIQNIDVGNALCIRSVLQSNSRAGSRIVNLFKTRSCDSSTVSRLLLRSTRLCSKQTEVEQRVLSREFCRLRTVNFCVSLRSLVVAGYFCIAFSISLKNRLYLHHTYVVRITSDANRLRPTP